MAIMARLTQCLQIGRIAEELDTAFMGADVVDDRGLDHILDSEAEPAERFVRQVAVTELLP